MKRIVQIISILLFGISFLCVVGYMTGNHALCKWTSGPEPQMALNTAIGFLLVSVSLFILSFDGNAGPFVRARD